MTLEDLIECDSAKWKLLPDKELEDMCAPWFPTTRPERIVRFSSPSSAVPTYIAPAKKKAMDFLKEQGLDLSEILGNKRKKK